MLVYIGTGNGLRYRIKPITEAMMPGFQMQWLFYSVKI